MSKYIISLFIVSCLLSSCNSCKKHKLNDLDKSVPVEKNTIKQGLSNSTIQNTYDSTNFELKKTAAENTTKKTIKKSIEQQPSIHYFEKNIATLAQKILNQIPVRELNEIKGKSSTASFLDFYHEASTSINRYFLLNFENDIFIEKDYYYTNGASLGLIHPVFRHFFLYKMLPTLGRYSLNYNGLFLTHAMYTPILPEQTEIDPNDRPFCGTLHLELMRISMLKEKRLILTSSLKLGVIGEISLASFFQSGVHDKTPTGWQFQIGNDIIFNGLIAVQKSFWNKENFDLAGKIEGNFGSFQNNINTTVKFKTGKFTSDYEVFHTAKATTFEKNAIKKFQYFFFLEPEIRYVFYNATISGGFLNNTSLHTFENQDITHLIFKARGGITFFYKRHGISLSFTAISPEFHGGYAHGWGSINYLFNF